MANIGRLTTELIAKDRIVNISASNVLMNQSALSFDDFIVTKNFATVTYTGNGDTQDITTGISSVDFTQPNNGSGYYNKRVGSGFAVIADNTVDLITSSNDTSSVDNWTAGNDANISSDGTTLSVNADTTDYPKATEIISLDAGTYALSCNLGGTTPLFNISNDNGLDISISTSKLITFTIDDTVDCTISCTMNGTEDDDTATFSNLSILPLADNGDGSCVCNVSKVHIKGRSEATHNEVFDGLRGKGVCITTNDTRKEDAYDVLTAFNVNGISLSSTGGINADTETYIAYQTLYTHIKWGKTNQDKRYIEAYNPVTRETMIMYEMSSSAGNKLPTSIGVKSELVEIKNLATAEDWLVQTEGLADTEKLVLNTDAAKGAI